MFRIAFLISVLMTGAAYAQQANDLAIGQTVSTEPTPGQTYLKDIVGDWEVRCIKAGEGEVDKCRIYQLLRQDNGNPIAEITLFALEPGNQAVAGGTIITPLESLLQRGIQITVDEGETKLYPFVFCTKVGCHSQVGFTFLDLAALEKGTNARLVIHARQQPEEGININMSLKGFTAAYDQLLGE